MAKKKPKKYSNPLVIPAKTRKGGPMRSKKDKRKNGKNKQSEYRKEAD